MTDNKVLFRFGSRAEYDALENYDANSLYFLLDTNELYRGNVPIGKTHYKEGTVRQGETLAQTIGRLTSDATPAVNDLVTVTDENGVDDLFIYTGSNTWKQLNATVRSENVIFSDSRTLDEVLSDVQSTINFNDDVLELDNDVLTLKDYGKQYYEYIEAVPAQGIEGQPDYVPAVPAHYELVQVDENHPWPSGLTPKTTIDGDLAWYAPNTSTLEGIQTTVSNLQSLIDRITEINNIQTQNITDLQNGLDELDGLTAIVGTVGDPAEGTESTGLVKRVEDLEEVLANGGVQKIKINNVELTAMNGTVNIPLFGENNDGAVPKFNTAISSLSQVNRNHVLLSVNGWVNPIGDLTYNSTTYNYVSEYVDARIEDSELKWQTINE